MNAPVCSTPLVSVVIPTYNHAHFLARALQSVLDQTYPNWEVIVVDNHSQDNTAEVIQGFEDSRITVLKIHNHGVIAASRNMGMRTARGEWIAFLDSDDLWYPDKLETVMKEARRDATIDVFSTDEVLVNDSTGERKLLRYGPYCQDFYKRLLLRGNCLSPSAALVRRDFLSCNRIGFRENKEFITAEDYDFWMICAREGAKFKCLRSVQGEYLIHATNSSGQAERHTANTVNVLRDHVYTQQSFQTDKDRIWRDINARLLVSNSKRLIAEKHFLNGVAVLVGAFRSSFFGTLKYLLFKIQN
jgi:glycosyltransferase involved in cell wall biosynthesis